MAIECGAIAREVHRAADSGEHFEAHSTARRLDRVTCGVRGEWLDMVRKASFAHVIGLPVKKGFASSLASPEIRICIKAAFPRERPADVTVDPHCRGTIQELGDTF